MHGRRSQSLERPEMRRCRVALVLLEAVAGVALGQNDHLCVAVHLRDDRRGRDASVLASPPTMAVCGTSMLGIVRASTST